MPSLHNVSYYSCLLLSWCWARCQVLGWLLVCCWSFSTQQVVADQPVVIAKIHGAGRVLVVCHADWRPTLEPWVKFRTAQGFTIQLLDPPATSAEFLRTLQQHQQQQPIQAVLLVGDVPLQAKAAPAAAANTLTTIPTMHLPARVITRWGGELQIATDFPFSDLDGDLRPELAIGRWSVDTREQLQMVVAKTLAHEQAPGAGPVRGRINLVAGVGGFGALTDAAIEQGARTIITSGLPASYEATLTFGSWTSPHCPDPRRFAECAQARMSEGALFWVYIGHGQPLGLDRVLMPDRQHYGILECPDCAALPVTNGSPIALLLACSTGAFDKPADCLAEELLVAPGGPVAVMASSRVAMPYGLSLFASEALHAAMQQRTELLGQVVQQAKTELVREIPEAKKRPTRQLLDSAAGLLTPGGHQARVESIEHTHLLQLFGDPCLSLRLPAELTIDAPATATAGQTVRVSCQLPVTLELAPTAKVYWELRLPLGESNTTTPDRPKYLATEQQWGEFQQTYEQSLQGTVQQSQQAITAHQLSTELTIPQSTRSRYVARVWITNGTQSYAGSALIKVTPRGK